MNTRKSNRSFNARIGIGTFLLLIGLLVLLLPVETHFSDSCGSAIFQTRVTFSLNGEIKHEVTPPCSEAHKKRMLWGVPLGSLGLVVIGLSIFFGNEDEEEQLT